jgi:hypothetical protein
VHIPTVAPSVLAPRNTAAPVVSGTPAVGGALTCSNGTWANAPTSFAYAWLRGDTEIGTITATYHPVVTDSSHTLRCRVIAKNAAGSTSATSTAVQVRVLTPGAPTNHTAPTITGVGAVGGTLTCSAGAWDGSPYARAYAWLRNGTLIRGANGASYSPVQADAGTSVSCRVTATNSAGNAVALSAPRRVARRPAGCLAPSLRGHTLASVKRLLAPAHCRLGKITRHRSRTVHRGRVITARPATGTVHPAGTRIALIVSRGP